MSMQYTSPRLATLFIFPSVLSSRYLGSMQWLQCSVLFLTATTICLSSNQEEQDDFEEDADDDDFSPIASSRNDRFEWRLSSSLLEQFQSKNLFWSPFSIRYLLVLLYEASVKETAEELQRTLQLDNNRMLVRARYGALQKILQAENTEYELVLKSRLFVDKLYAPQQWYQNVLARDYDTYVQRVTFKRSDAAADEINKWAREATHGLIDSAVTGDSVKGSELIMMNAVYFKGLWQKPFLPEDTYYGQFSTSSQHKTTRFMTQTDLFYLSESDELDAQLLRMPYKGKTLAMYIMLPRKENGLNDMMQKIRPFLLKRMVWQLEQNMVTVIVPTFKFETTIDLKEHLKRMGISSIFNKYDNLIGIKSRSKPNGQSYVQVSSIIQKTTIDITETGTTASAITDTRFTNKVNFPPVTFNASHAFMFFIKNEETGTIIFQGKFSDPDENAEVLETTHVEKLQEGQEQEVLNETAPNRRKERYTSKRTFSHHRHLQQQLPSPFQFKK